MCNVFVMDIFCTFVSHIVSRRQMFLAMFNKKIFVK